MAEVRIFDAISLHHGQSVTFTFEAPFGDSVERREGFLLRYHDIFLAFTNECPHWSVELDLGDGHFYDESIDRIYCKNHGALFVLPSGMCETGPCLGRNLESLKVKLEGQDVVVSV